MRKIKPFEDLTFHDDFMFGLVMQDKEICREALECLLGKNIQKIEYTEPQKSLNTFCTSHAIRLDVYVDDGNTVYDVEVQNKNEKNLGRRTRYYQGIMDVDSLEKGRVYTELKNSVIIFLCTFDPFKKAIPCYTVKRECLQDRSVGIDDGAVVHIFNCTAYEKVKNESLKAFLKFVQTDMAESEFTRRIGSMVETQKAVESNKKFYLSWSLHDTDIRLEGREEGIRIGEKRGKKEGMKQGMNEKAVASARNFLAMNVLTHEQIAKGVGLPIEKIEELAAEQAKAMTLQED